MISPDLREGAGSHPTGLSRTSPPHATTGAVSGVGANDAPHRLHLLTSSRLRTAQECPRRHLYRYELCRTPYGTSRASELGTAVHAGLEAWWVAIREGAAQYALASALSAAEAAYPTDDAYAAALLRALVFAYDARWSEWAQTCEVIGVEVAFEAPLRHPTRDGVFARSWRVAGKIDALVRLSDGRVAIVEHKCVAGDARIFDHSTGTYERVDALYARGRGPAVTAVDEIGAQHVVQTPPIRLASVRPIYRVATLGGRSLRVSGNHPVMTVRGWVAAEDLTADDWVAVPKRMPSAVGEAPLSDEEVRVIGYMIGDGYTPRAAFTKNDSAVVADLIRCAASMGENATPIRQGSKATCVRFSTVGPVARLMQRAGLDESLSADKRIPFYLALSDRQLGQLVGALWSTDGCIDTFGGKKLRIIYTSVSRGLCEDIQHALQRLGVVSNVRTTSVLYKGARRPVSTVNVVSREGRRAFLRLAAEGAIPVLRSKVPIADAPQFIPTSRQADDSTKQPAVSPSIWWDRIESIEIHAAEQTYDIEVPGVHTFVVGGIVTHNTTSMDASAGSDYRRKLTLDPQVSTYFDGAEALGLKADLCLYDVLRKPSIKPLLATPLESQKRTKAGALYANQREHDETATQYEARLIETIAADPEKHLLHAEIVRSDEEREAHAWALWHAVRQIEDTRRAYRESGCDARAVPQNPGACLTRGRCDFLDVCEGTASITDDARFKALETAHPELPELSHDNATT